MQGIRDHEFLDSEKYPYKPDVVMGYKGNKIGLFVLNEGMAMRDSFLPNGVARFRMRILERAQKNQIKTAAVAVPKVVHYDIEGLKVQLNESFNF